MNISKLLGSFSLMLACAGVIALLLGSYSFSQFHALQPTTFINVFYGSLELSVGLFFTLVSLKVSLRIPEVRSLIIRVRGN